MDSGYDKLALRCADLGKWLVSVHGCHHLLLVSELILHDRQFGLELLDRGVSLGCGLLQFGVEINRSGELLH